MFARPSAHRYPSHFARVLEANRTDALFVYGYASAISLAALRAARALGLPVVMSGDTHEQGREQAKWKARLKAAILPQLLRGVDSYVAIGEWNHAYWEKYGVSGATIADATYAVDNDFFARRSQGSSAELELRWRKEHGETVFLYVGRLVGVKGVDLLLEAFSRLTQPARLVLVGEGPERARLGRLAEELGCEQRTIFEGFINQNRLPDVYRSADVFVLPSFYEPWGLVVNEALACGTPCVVSSAVGAGPDLVRDEGAGHIFESGSAESLREALTLACDPAIRTRWTLKAERAVAKATPTRTAQVICDLVEQACRRVDSSERWV